MVPETRLNGPLATSPRVSPLSFWQTMSSPRLPFESSWPGRLLSSAGQPIATLTTAALISAGLIVLLFTTDGLCYWY